MAIRKDQSDLTDAEKTAFVDAIMALKQASSMLHPGSPTSSRYDDYVELHVKAMMAMPDGWAHEGPAFFPWHRVLLIQFERDLQQATGNPDRGSLIGTGSRLPNSRPFLAATEIRTTGST